MNKFFRYLALGLKRAARIYPLVLGFTLILSLCAALLLTSLFAAKAENKRNLKVGVVGDIGDSYLNIGVDTLQSFDSSRFYLTFVNVDDEESAQKRLTKGEFIGYVVIPEGFADSLSDEIPATLKYVSQNAPNSIAPLLTEELVGIVSQFVLESQNGIYGVEDIAWDHDVEIDMYDANMTFINSVLARDTVYDVEVLGVGNGLGFTAYYIFALIMVLILLWGITGCLYLVRTDMALPRLLCSRSYGSFLQIIAEYIPFTVMTALNLTIIVLALSLFPSEEIYHTLSYAIESPAAALMTSLKLVPLAMLICSMQFFLYELCSNIISALLTQLLSMLALSYISGFFYPLSALPMPVQKFSALLPTGIGFDYAVRVFSYDLSFANLAALILYTALFLILSTAVREYKIRRSHL